MDCEKSVIDEYFRIYKESVEQYGEKTVVLIEYGSFYEIYSIENEKESVGNARVISEIIRCDFTSKNKAKRATEGYSTRTNPDFCGFGTAFLKKYIPPLLNENYTVVIINQLEDAKSKKGKTVKRGVTAVYSPTLKSPEYETINDADSNLVGIFIEVVYSNNTMANAFLYSVCSINNVTNDIEVCDGGVDFYNMDEMASVCLEELNRVLLRYNTKEMQINMINNDQKVLDRVDKYFSENYTNFKLNGINEDDERYKEYIKPIVQNEYFGRVYKHLSFGLLKPLEFLNLSTRPLSVINLMYIFDFIGKHDLKYLSNLSVPRLIEDDGCLVLALNTLSQLNVVDNTHGVSGKFSSVYDTVNFTSTAIGRRYLKKVLTKPFRDYRVIKQRYDLTEEMRKVELGKLEKILVGLLDFERMHRKMALEALHPYEFEKLDGTYLKMIEMVELLKENGILGSVIPNGDMLKEFQEYVKDYLYNFDMEKLKLVNLNTKKEDMINFFKVGVIVELDEIEQKIKDIESEIESMRMMYDELINENLYTQQFVKIDYTDQDGHFFTCTKLRFEKIKSLLKKEDVRSALRTKMTNNTVKFFTDELVKKSYELMNNRELLTKNVKMCYLNKLKGYSTRYTRLFSVLKEFVEIVDITKSNLKCALKYNYCRPDICDNESSWVDACEMRHPIIERLVLTEYVSNDIKLDSNNLGIILYGLNACGKSTLLRATGISIILAQSGLYVPCKSFKYSPFSTLISQVDLTDNLFMGKSSFITEMIGLKKILSVSGENTLILSDELCKGTETSSAEAIVASTIVRLMRDKSKFFFTSHLHGIPELKAIKEIKKLQVSHLSIDIAKEDGDIVFERKIKNGSGSRLYGLEVCKSIIGDVNFIDQAFEIRNNIIGNKTDIVSKKRSNYNRKKRLTSCEVCGYKPKDKNSIPLETHHINEQQNTDERGFVNDKHFHKNELYNLVCLCKTCHQKIDTGELVVRGYKQSVSGLFLDWE